MDGMKVIFHLKVKHLNMSKTSIFSIPLSVQKILLLFPFCITMKLLWIYEVIFAFLLLPLFLQFHIIYVRCQCVQHQWILVNPSAKTTWMLCLVPSCLWSTVKFCCYCVNFTFLFSLKTSAGFFYSFRSLSDSQHPMPYIIFNTCCWHHLQIDINYIPCSEIQDVPYERISEFLTQYSKTFQQWENTSYTWLEVWV